MRFDDLWAFDIHSAAWTLLEPDGARPPPRAHHTATFIESTSTHPARLLIFGGYGGYRGARTFFSDLFCLDLESMVWTPIQALGDAPPPRADHAACLIDGKFLAIFGGRSTSEYFNDIHILQVDTMQWTTHKKMGNPHHWLALCSHCVEVRPIKPATYNTQQPAYNVQQTTRNMCRESLEPQPLACIPHSLRRGSPLVVWPTAPLIQAPSGSTAGHTVSAEHEGLCLRRANDRKVRPIVVELHQRDLDVGHW